MLKLLLDTLGWKTNRPISGFDGPYTSAFINLIYQRLFCDQMDLYRKALTLTTDLSYPWSLLYEKNPSRAALRSLANDETVESCIRMLAFNALRGQGETISDRTLLGIVFEVGLPRGLDTMAVFADGSARYIKHTGAVSIVEKFPNPFQTDIEDVINSCRPLYRTLKPDENDRPSSPDNGIVQLTFLASDGASYATGSIREMQKNPFASPLINSGSRFLRKLNKLRETNMDLRTLKPAISRSPILEAVS